MRFRQPYSLPELLTLLSARQSFPGSAGWGLPLQPGAARLRQVIRLAKEGIRECSHRLEALERQGEWRPWDRNDGSYNPDWVRRDRG